MSSTCTCSHKHYIADTDEKGVPSTYKNSYKEYDAHSFQCGNYQAPQSIYSTWKRYHPEIASSVPAGKHKLFDAGCGTGLVIEVLVKANEYNRQDLDIYGGDYSEEMLSIAREKGIFDNLKVLDLNEELSYEPEAFDSIVCAGVFLEGHCGPECLPNIFQVLKKGCYFIATVRTPFYLETKEEWNKQIQACGAVLTEEFLAPYTNYVEGTVLVIQKQ